jgi:hypothetical protein
MTGDQLSNVDDMQLGIRWEHFFVFLFFGVRLTILFGVLRKKFLCLCY